MSIVSHSVHCPTPTILNASSTTSTNSATTTPTTVITPSSSVIRPSLLSIPRRAPPTSLTSASSTSSTSTVPSSAQVSGGRLGSHGRKLRSSRPASSGSSSSSQSGSASPGLSLSRPPAQQTITGKRRPSTQGSDCSDLEDDTAQPRPLQRLKLERVPPANPPTPIPPNIELGPPLFETTLTPWVASSPNSIITDKSTYTSVRSSINPHSVSISSEPPSHFSKTILKQPLKQGRVALKAKIEQVTIETSAQSKQSEEQDKWWHWSKACKFTGDGNKSAYLNPLWCRDLSQASLDYHDHKTNITTRKMTGNALEHQKFYCTYPSYNKRT